MNKIKIIGLLAFSLFLVKPSFSQEAKEKKENNNHLKVETQFLLRNDSAYTPNIKFRYFINDKGAVRLASSYSFSSNKIELFETSGDGVGTLERINELFRLSIGYEKHFVHEKFASYVGGELLFGVGRSDIYGSRTDSSSFVPDFDFSSKTPISQFGVQLFTGVDIKIYEGLYIGTEIGVNFLNSQQKRGAYKAEDGSSTTAATIEESIPAITNKSFSVGGIGLIRLGWKF